MEVTEISLTQEMGRNYEKWKYLVWPTTVKKENLNSTTKKTLETKIWSISDYKEVCGINVNINYPARNYDFLMRKRRYCTDILKHKF